MANFNIGFDPEYGYDLAYSTDQIIKIKDEIEAVQVPDEFKDMLFVLEPYCGFVYLLDPYCTDGDVNYGWIQPRLDKQLGLEVNIQSDTPISGKEIQEEIKTTLKNWGEAVQILINTWLSKYPLAWDEIHKEIKDEVQPYINSFGDYKDLNEMLEDIAEHNPVI